MPQPPTEFDDPQLKLTLRRAIGATAADADLRRAVANLIRRETQGPAPADAALELKPLRPAGRRPFVRFAIAATLLLGAGAGGGFLWHRHHEAAEQAEYLAANLPLFRALIAAQDHPPPAAVADAPPFPLDDRAALRKALAAKLARPVPVPDWRDKGWQLVSADVAPIRAHVAAQLRYQNAGRSVLFVSLPAAAYTGEAGETPEPYQYEVDGHALAGFVRDAGLHCAIGDARVTAREIADLKID